MGFFLRITEPPTRHGMMELRDELTWPIDLAFLKMMQPNSEPDISEWLERVRHGDQVAIQAIYRRYYAALHAFIRLHIRDEGAAEEIVDDTFMVVFTQPHQFEGRSAFKTWLYAIAKNQCHDWLRRTAREPVAHPNNSDQPLNGLISED